jgi:hypothetical protein
MTYTEEQYDEFVKTLEAKYPLMFSQPYGGVAVGTGWWPIIESLCANIQSHVDWKNEQRDRFQRGEGCQQVVVEQIKEKFGGLRFYYQGGNEQIHGMVRMAEAWADRTCEECGRPGQSRSGGWVRTLCDEHEAERQARMAAYRESMPT